MLPPGYSLFPFSGCPELTLSIIARVPLHYYPTLSCTLRTVKSLVASRELFEDRSNLGISEPLLCICISEKCAAEADVYNWYCLGKMPDVKTSPSSSGFCLMRMKMDISYRAQPSMASAGSTISLIAEKLYSNLKLLDCRTHLWSATPNMKIHPRNRGTSFIYGIKDSVYVLGGLGGLKEEGQHLRPEFYSTTQRKGWIALPEPELERNRKVVLVGSTDGKNLAFWSLSGPTSLKHTLNSETGLWSIEPSGYFPSVYGNFSHTLFVENLLIRVIGRKISWFDELASKWNDVQNVKLPRCPVHVSASGSSLVAFFTPKYSGGKRTLIATEISLQKRENLVFGTQLWVDEVFSTEFAIVIGSSSVNI